MISPHFTFFCFVFFRLNRVKRKKDLKLKLKLNMDVNVHEGAHLKSAYPLLACRELQQSWGQKQFVHRGGGVTRFKSMTRGARRRSEVVGSTPSGQERSMLSPFQPPPGHPSPPSSSCLPFIPLPVWCVEPT